MIKLFSLNHTETQRFQNHAQDKTQSRRVTVLIFRVRNTSASAHTNYLVNFLKSVEPLLNQGRVFYRESRPCQPFVFSSFETLKTTKLIRLTASIEARILLRTATLSTPPGNFLSTVSQESSSSYLPRLRPSGPSPSEVVRILQPHGKLSTACEKKIQNLRFPRSCLFKQAADCAVTLVKARS